VKRTAHHLLTLGVAFAFAASVAAGANAPVLARGVHHGAVAAFKTGLPSCGNPLPCVNTNALEGLGGAEWVKHLDPSWVTDTESQNFVDPLDSSLDRLLPFQLPASKRNVLNSNGWISLQDAKSVKLSNHGRTWTFTLKKGLHFADGDPITPFDFKWSLARADIPSLGSPVTAYYDGYIKGVNAIANGSSNMSIDQALNMLTGVSYSTKHRTVSYTTTSRTPFFLEALTYQTSWLLNPGCAKGCNSAADLKHAVNGMARAGSAEYTDHNWLRDNCQGAQESSSGQFMAACISGGTDGTHANFFPAGSTPTVTLEPNPRYSAGRKVHFIFKAKVVDTADNGYNDFNSGGPNALQYTTIPSVDLAGVKKDCSKTKNNGIPKACPKRGGDAFGMNPTSVVQYFTPNESLHYSGKSGPGSPFHWLACRLVFAYGVNTAAIVAVLHHSVQQLHSILPANIGGYLGSHPSGVPSYNPKKAESYVKPCTKALSKAAGHTIKTFSFDVTYPTGSQDAFNEQARIQHFLNKIKGVHETITPIDVNTWFGYAAQNLNANNLPIISNGWQEDFPDGFDYETLLLGHKQGYNIGNWEANVVATKGEANAVNTYNKLINKAATSFNNNLRTTLYKQAAHIAMSQGVWITRFNSLGFVLVKSNIHGLVGSPQYGFPIPANDDWSNVSVK
jgi:ABC-type transport system substrate-binding protein